MAKANWPNESDGQHTTHQIHRRTTTIRIPSTTHKSKSHEGLKAQDHAGSSLIICFCSMQSADPTTTHPGGEGGFNHSSGSAQEHKSFEQAKDCPKARRVLAGV